MYIDAHGHARDNDFFDRTGKETIGHVLEVCRDVGIDGFFDMPNTREPVTNEKKVEERLGIAKEADVPEVFYGTYVGLTANPEQIKWAVDIFRKRFPQVVGLKLYAGHSVGDLGVISVERQAIIYRTLAAEGYTGVLCVHCEKEEELKPDKWNPKKPITHCYARPGEAEIESVRDQLFLAKTKGFKGKLHFAHLSVSESVRLVTQTEELDVSCEVAPHHLIYDKNAMVGKDGLWYKVNPPLREPEEKGKLLVCLKAGTINFIADDHAPHETGKKLNSPYMSGIVGIPYWPLFEEFLRSEHFSDEQIEDVMFNNVLRRFNMDNIERRRIKPKNRIEDYPFHYYKALEERLRFKW